MTRWLSWLAVVPLAALAVFSGEVVPRSYLVLSLIAALLGLWRWRVPAARASAALTLAALCALAWRLLQDDFSTHYVWLTSAPEIPWYLKLANLWGGDQGTLLLLGTIGFALAISLCRRPGWGGPGALLTGAAFAAAALVWDPFRATPPEALAETASRAMNAHLTRIWMVFHPPQVFLAFLLFLAPAGAALQALVRGDGDWPALARSYSRWGWFLLSLGTALGMWWAYEDFTYGTLWHWDPVQTGIFVTWCFATAQLHTLRRYRPGGAFALTSPLLGLLTAIAGLATMVITRSPHLASSHRYLGESSLMVFVVLAGLLAVATLVAVGVHLARRPRPRNGVEARLWFAIALFSFAGLIAAGHLTQAYIANATALPRSDDLKPFFETLRRFANAQELVELRAAFAQWDVDGFGLNRWLAPVGCALALIGGHYLLPLRGWRRWLISGAVAVLGLWLALEGQVFGRFYQGLGLTSGKTLALFGWLDFMTVAGLYMAVAALTGWLAALRRRTPARAQLGYEIPVAVIHTGAMVALLAGLSATVLDSYAQRMVSYPDDFGRPLAFPDGYELTVSLEQQGTARDGAFTAIAEVGWSLSDGDRLLVADQGHTVYQDSRPPADGSLGPVRMMCEIIDYRYARYVSESHQMIHPLISRGLTKDVQIWFPALPLEPDAGSQAPLVMKVYPLLSWVWIGLTLILLGHLMVLVTMRR
ncbi:MAG: cytochrome c biogenesis protein CcsA [Pseudomonadota bacterium]